MSAESNIARAPATELSVSGMSCNNCARHVTEAIQSVAGVRNASVILDAGRASVRWTSGVAADVPAVLAAIKAAGYEAKSIEATTPDHSKHRRSGWQFNLWIGVLGTVPLMLGEWIFDLGMARWFQWLSFGQIGRA